MSQIQKYCISSFTVIAMFFVFVFKRMRLNLQDVKRYRLMSNDMNIIDYLDVS